ncbi:McrB family protein [Acinetobacter gerneri]|uniref:McrB family protein n=1 Tax=Acinetobacter gerneri TaxID=202952 RepID=UPI0028B0549D|nr:AAA family ATPase [Acinetobacter gerneri]
MSNSELYKLWDEFLVSWPVEHVRNMTLEEYSEAGNQDAFIHWVEFRTKSLAIISGTSSFIFGIYGRKDQSSKKNTKHYIYEDQYAWRSAYGKTKEQAFSHVKSEIIKVIEAVQNNQLHLINDVDLFKTVKWKIAFLYQDRENIRILPTFAEQRLRFLTGIDQKAKDFKIEDAYIKLLEEKGEKELFKYNAELTQKYLGAHPKEKFNTQIAYDYMHERYPTFEKNAEYLFVIKNKYSYELALETTNFDKPSPRLFLKYIPPKYIKGLQVNSIPKGKSPNSNLESTKTLTREDEFVQVTITNMQQLEALCNWWDELNESNQDSSETSKLEVSQMEEIAQPLNRILFGAAGTGKTYNTINHALAILENKELIEIEKLEKEQGGRIKLKGLFDKYKNEGCIKVVTFHQSFSYEDFIEGIRAEIDVESDQLTYAVKSGVFKDICEKASGQYLQLNKNENILDHFLEEISINSLMLNTIKNKEFKVSYIGHGHVIHCQPLASENNATYRANINSIREILQGNEPEILYNSSYVYAIANFIKQKYQPIEQKENLLQPYVLIIDEINRGNISRIFGELITLIEDSKRQGAEEELSVILPYSKKEFSVPSNIYIIGTMNSSDRSLTGLDIALRRRFTFIEMPPKPELLSEIEVEGLNVGELLKVINQRIEVLLDRDHCIGHANFMSLKKQPTLEHLAVIFKQKLIPQLQEYFFDDWAKINMVLNANGMLKPKPIERSVLFPNVDTESEGLFEDQKIWQIIETAFDSVESFAKIIKY